MNTTIKIAFVILLFITTVFAVLLFTTDHFEITFPILFVFSMITLITFLTSSDFDD